MKPQYTRPEILAPAGNKEMMHAAVENGADAVYFGVQAFNARLRADNFSLEELPETMSYLHSRGVKGYLTTNTLIFNEELEQAIDLLKACSNAGVDAILVQDLGLAYLANKIAPELPIHASTQMTLTSAESILGAEKLGLKLERVVTARELSKKELSKFLAETSKEIEVFVHGALCVAYSGQCLTSESLGGRSANRGECAQACRLPYDLIVDGIKKDLGDISYLLSPKDLAAYDDISELIKIGIVSLKIEGRLKTPEYVAATVQTYRHVVDTFFNAKENEPFVLEKKYLRKLENSFSRGFTGGYIHDLDHQKVVEGRFPTKRGTFLGEVIKITDQAVVARICGPLHVGDGVVFDSGHPDRDIGGKIFYLVEKGKNIKVFDPDVEKIKEKVLELEFNLSEYKFSQIRVGNKIWKTKDPHIEANLQESFQGENIRFHRALRLEVRAEVGKCLWVKAIDAEGFSAECTDDLILEKAQKRPVTKEVLEEQLGRLGDSPFYLEELSAEIVDGPMVPLSRLNGLRRQVVEELLGKRKEIGRGRVVNDITLKDIRDKDFGNGEIASVVSLPRNDINTGSFGANSDSDKLGQKMQQHSDTQQTNEISILCRTLAQVEAAVSLNVKRIYTDFEDIRHQPLARKLINNSNIKYYPATLRIIKPQEAAGIRKLFNSEPDGILVRNLASWHVITKERPDLKLIADFSFNVSNDITAKLLLKNGLELLTPSYDLNYEQLLSMLSQCNPQDFEITAHQYMPMFHMEHCVFCRFLSSGTDSSNCGRPCETHSVSIQDRKGYQHPVKVDFNCRNTVFNGVAQSAAEYLTGLTDLGVNKFRLDLLEETAEEVITIYNLYQDTLNQKIKTEDLWKTLKANSKLGVTKGSMDHEMVTKDDQLYQIRIRKPAHSKTNPFQTAI